MSRWVAILAVSEAVWQATITGVVTVLVAAIGLADRSRSKRAEHAAEEREEARAEIEELRDEVRDLKAETASFKAEAAQWYSMVRDLRNELTALEAELRQRDLTIASLRARLPPASEDGAPMA